MTKIRCIHCPDDKTGTFAYNQSTSTHISHLRRCHGNLVDVRRDFPSEQQEDMEQYVEKGNKKRVIPVSRERAERITRAVAALVYLDIRPVNIVEGRAFNWLVRELEPGIQS